MLWGAMALHGSAWGEDKPSAQTKRVNGRDGLFYVWVAPGRYFTGCERTDSECIGWELPRREVVIANGFWMGQTEVTQEAFARVMGGHPSRYPGPKRPVEQVNWDDARAYCTAVRMRLPTEAEWEFAAMGGVQAPRPGVLGTIAWFDGNAGDQTHDVAQKEPNGYGLYDMLGNVWEWVDEVASFDAKRRVMKGGSFYNLARGLRVPNRETPVAEMRHRNVGFRCVAGTL